MRDRTRDAGNAQRRKRGKPFWAPVAGKPKASDETATIPYQGLRGFDDARGSVVVGRRDDDVGRREQAANNVLREAAKREGRTWPKFRKEEGIYLGAMEGEEAWRKTEVPMEGVSPEDTYESTGRSLSEQGAMGGGAVSSSAYLSSSDLFDNMLFGGTVERPARAPVRDAEDGRCDCDVCALYRHTQSVDTVAAQLAPRGREFTQCGVLKTLQRHGTVLQDGKTTGRRLPTYMGSASEHTRIISDGRDMAGQGEYLRAVGLLAGLGPQEHWDRHFGRLTSRQQSLIRARERTWGWEQTDLARPTPHRTEASVKEGTSRRGRTGSESWRQRARQEWVRTHPLGSFTEEGLFERLAQYLGKYRPYSSLPPEAYTAMPAGATAPDGPLATTWVFMGQVPDLRELAQLGVAADELGLTDEKAAERLGVTQPALSKARKELRAKADARRRVRKALEQPESTDPD